MHWKKRENLCRLLHGLDAITLSYSKEATKLNALLTRPDYSAALHKLPDHVITVMTSAHAQPKCLMNTCRMRIIKSLAPNSHRKVPMLPIPSAIKKYLLFRDLDEMLLDMADRRRKSIDNNLEHTVPACQEYSKGSDSSESEEDEDRDYNISWTERKKEKNKSQKMQHICKTEPKPRKKLCLCTI